MRSTPERDAWMRQRLQEAVDGPAGGSADKLGRMLGYTNGGYIREILKGAKPVRAAIIERANDVDELRGWFGMPEAAPEAESALPEHLKPLIRRILALTPEQQEEALAAAVQVTVYVKSGVPVEVRPLERALHAGQQPNQGRHQGQETTPTSGRATTQKSTASRSR
jgi:hypothetical protein